MAKQVNNYWLKKFKIKYWRLTLMLFYMKLHFLMITKTLKQQPHGLVMSNL